MRISIFLVLAVGAVVFKAETATGDEIDADMETRSVPAPHAAQMDQVVRHPGELADELAVAEEVVNPFSLNYE